LWLKGFNVLFIFAVRAEATFGHEPRKGQSNSFTIELLLLKQADASKKKLTLTRLSSAPVPFTVLSMASNPGRCTGRLRLEGSSRHDADFRWIGPRPFSISSAVGDGKLYHQSSLAAR
jgi:hypothetical protein